MPLKQPPRSSERLPDFGIGAPAAPPAKAPVFHLKPKKGPLADAQRAQRALEKAQREAAAAELKRNNAIFAARQEQETKAAIQQRVAAKAGLAPTSSPFAGAEKGKGPGAKPGTKIESANLTDQSKLAKERLRLLTQGGLQGPAQRLDAMLAQDSVAGSRNLRFGDTHQLPAELSQPSRHIPTPPPRLNLGAPPAPTQVTPNARGNIYQGHLKPINVDIPRPSVDWTRLKRLIESGAPSDSAIGSVLRVTDLATGAARAIAPKQAQLPHVQIPNNFLNESAQAASKGQPVYVDQLTDKQRYGDYALGAKARAYFVKLAVANGYNEKDAPTWNDADLAARALGPHNEHTITGLLRNLAADVGQQASLANAVTMYGDTAKQAIEQRSVAPIARLGGEYAQGWLKLLPHYGDRPWVENFYERPLSTYLAVAPVAKGLSGLAGRGLRLAPTREAVLPTQRAAVEAGALPPGSERVTLPASQHPIARLGQAAHDRLMAAGVHPHERAARERAVTTVRHPSAEIGHILGEIPQRVGNKLEERVVRRQIIDAQHMKARLTAGHEPALALQELFKSYRQLPMMRTLLESWKENGGKEAEMEAVIKHHGAASSSDQLAESYLAHAQNSLARAAELEIDAELAPNEATAARYRAGAQELVADAKRQQEQATYSTNAAIDIRAPKKGVQEMVDAMRKASRESAAILRSQGLIDEKGQLYGDWQHRIDTIEHTEGPGTARGGETGTPAYQIAHAIIRGGGLREAHDVARAAYHGRTTQDINEVPASMDVRTDIAQHHAGRNRFAREVLRIVTGKQNDRNARVSAAGNADLGVDAASLGLDRRGVQRAVQEAGNLLNQKHAQAEQIGHTRSADAAEQIRNLHREEKAAHEARSNERINRLEADLHVAEVRKAPRVKIDEIKREIEQERKVKGEGFTPSRDLLNAVRSHERASLHRFSFELRPAEVDAIVARVRNAQGGLDKTPEQESALRAAIQQEIDRSPALNTAAQLARAIEQDSATKFKANTGKDVQLAHNFDAASANYLRALRGLRDEQLPQGYDPFHLHLHRPDTEYGLQPTTITTGVQWQEGNYTRDMHFLVARDLAGLQRKAVEGALFQALGREDLIITDPPPGSAIPPGWVEAPAELIANIQKVNKDPHQVRELLAQWRDLGSGSHAGGRLSENHVLVSRHMKDWMTQELERGNHQEIGRLLKATNAYRRWMLFSLPRTYVNNTVGNPILAMVMGAKLRDLTEAVHLLRNHPERIPNTLRRRGPISNVMEKANAKMVGWQAFWRNANAFSEDIGNVMVYLKHARNGFKDANNLRWFNHISKTNELWADYLHKAAKGETDDAVGPSIKSAEAFGDMYRLSKHDNAFATAFLFHRWVGHMIHLTYWTLPTRYPGRALFIQQTAALANQYRKEHGEFPSWAVAYVPLWHEIQQAGGLPQDVVWSLGTGGVNPFATAGQSIDFGTVDQPKFPAQSLVANNITPLIRVPVEALYGHRLDTLQPFQDYHGNDITAGMNWRVFANGVIANLPIVNTVFPRAGLSDDTIQIPLNIPGVVTNRLHPRYSSSGAYDPSMRAPQALGHGELYDWLLRIAGAFGSPIRPVDAAGNRTQTSANKTLTWQAQQKVLRDNKKAAADFQNQLELFQRDPDAWRKKYGPKP